MKKPGQRRAAAFRAAIRRYYREHGRTFAWRQTSDPYAVLVSEIMLQQTQTERVRPKYRDFLKRFPSFAALAGAQTREVLEAWQGLGYNRRALALKRCAEEVMANYGGELPTSPEELERLPGIGPYTARAAALFAFGRPSVFIETNIRAVFIHFFFAGRSAVRDAELAPLIEATLPRTKVREWYYALMDYGVMLKQTERGITRRSAHYVRQSTFRGSRRELRGAVVRLTARGQALTLAQIKNGVPRSDANLLEVLKQLCAEGFISCSGGRYRCGQVRRRARR